MGDMVLHVLLKGFTLVHNNFLMPLKQISCRCYLAVFFSWHLLNTYCDYIYSVVCLQSSKLFLTTNLINVLQWKAKGLVGGAGRGHDGIQSFKQGSSSGSTVLTLDLPALKPTYLEWMKQKHDDTHGVAVSVR